MSDNVFQLCHVHHAATCITYVMSYLMAMSNKKSIFIQSMFKIHMYTQQESQIAFIRIGNKRIIPQYEQTEFTLIMKKFNQQNFKVKLLLFWQNKASITTKDYFSPVILSKVHYLLWSTSTFNWWIRKCKESCAALKILHSFVSLFYSVREINTGYWRVWLEGINKSFNL